MHIWLQYVIKFIKIPINSHTEALKAGPKIVKLIQSATSGQGFTGIFRDFLQERTSVLCTILKADIAVCWTAEHIYALAMLILCGLYLRSGRWKNHKI